MAKGNMKAIKRRVKSVSSTLQITKAMEMVASSKLRKAKQKAETIRPYFENLYALLSEIATENIDFSTVFTRPRKQIKRRLFIVIAGDRGLAGGYNSNIMKLVAANMNNENGEEKPKIIAIGKKAIEFYEKHGFDIVLKYPNFLENVKVTACAEIAQVAADLFANGEIDEVKVFYTAFISSLVQDAREVTMLPLENIGGRDEQRRTISSQVDYDPNPEAVFNRIVPKFILSAVHCACVESFASEQCARRIAMESASDNAKEMITTLSLQYNRARQEKITNEINEIVAGANSV